MKDHVMDGATPSERSMSTRDNYSNPQDEDPMDEIDGIEQEPEFEEHSKVPERYRLRALVDPHNLSLDYLAKVNGNASAPTRRYWRQNFYRWEWDHWEEMADYEIEGPLSTFIRESIDALVKKYPDNKELRKTVVTKGMVHNVQHAVMSKVSIKAALEPPVFIDGRNTPGGLLPLANGILDIRKALEGRVKPIQPHTPQLFNLSCASYEYDANAKCPLWLEFVTKVMNGDPELIALTQEICGWALVADTSFQKFVILVGEGANGKGVFCEVLTAMVGKDNVSHVPAGAFGDKFQLANTMGKLLNIEPDAGQITSKAEAAIKSFTAGDRMNFERKYKQPFSALPTARLIIGTNSLPKFEDRSSGIWRRMILLPFQVTIPVEERDRKLAEKLKAELPGILNWSLEGLKRLREQGHFTEPAICKAGLDDYRKESNPARLFLTENYAVDEPLETIECGDVYARYYLFCKSFGYTMLNDSEFGKEVRRVFPKAEKKRGTTGNRAYQYQGLRYIGTADPVQQ